MEYYEKFSDYTIELKSQLGALAHFTKKVTHKMKQKLNIVAYSTT